MSAIEKIAIAQSAIQEPLRRALMQVEDSSHSLNWIAEQAVTEITSALIGVGILPEPGP